MSSTSSQTEKVYEVLAIFAGSLKESDRSKEIEKLEKEISSLGKIGDKTIWENRPLAYKIKKEITGTYFICNFTASSEKITEFENFLRLNQKVIRHVLYAVPKNYEWKDYTSEDLEHSFTKEEAPRKSFVEKPVIRKEIKVADIEKVKIDTKESSEESSKEIAEPPKKKESKDLNMNKKLDDILSDL